MKKPIPLWPKVVWRFRRDKRNVFTISGHTLYGGCQLSADQSITQIEISQSVLPFWMLRHRMMEQIRNLFAQYTNRKAA